MRNKFSKIGTLALGLSLSFSIGLHANFNVNKTEEANAATYTTDASTYYNGITATSGQALAGQLHDLITTTHQTYTSYDDNGKNGKQKTTDRYYENGSPVSGYIYEFYSGVKWPDGWYPDAGKTNGGYNREHCWCQSNSVNTGGTQMWGTTGGGADMHHLRPVESRLNSTRNNHPYGEVTNRDSNKVYAKFGTQTTYALGGYCAGDVFEPLDSKKGDVARIILYTYIHYNSYTVTQVFGSGNATTNGTGGQSSYFSTSFLSLTKTTNQTTEANAISMLLSWNESDPVDEIEQRRNEEVAKIQGNRNPFIDNANYANMIWGSNTDPTVHSVSVSPSTLSLDVNGTTTGNLTATVTVSHGAPQTVNWTSSNTNVATVSSSGVVTAVKKGTCSITATSTFNENKSASCTVTVSDSSSGGETISDTVSDSVNASEGALPDWTASGTGTAYADGSVKFDGTGDNVYNLSLFSGDVSSNMTNLVVTVNSKNNTGGTGSEDPSNNSYIVEALASNGSVLGTQTKTQNIGTSYVDLEFTLTSNLAGCVGLRITYSNKAYGNWAVKSVSWTATYETSSGSTTSVLDSISLNTSNVQTSFFVGETFDYSGLIVIGHFDDGTDDVVSPTNVSNPDMSTYGEKTITVTCGSVSATYAINVSYPGSTATSQMIVNKAGSTYFVDDAIYLSGSTTSGSTECEAFAAVQTKHAGTHNIAYDANELNIYSNHSFVVTPNEGYLITSIVVYAKTDSDANGTGGYLTNCTKSTSGSVVTFTATSGTSAVGFRNTSSVEINFIIVNFEQLTLSWDAPEIDVFSGATLTASDVNSWNVSDGNTTYTSNQLTIKLDDETISIPHTWVAEDDGKSLTASINGIYTPESEVIVTQTINTIYEPYTPSPESVSWNASSASNLGSTIDTVGDTANGHISTGTFEWDYTRRLTSGTDYLGYGSAYGIQVGKNGGVENATFTTDQIPGTIKSVSVYCGSYSGNHKISITVGGSTFLASTSMPSGQTASEMKGTGSDSGTITILITNGTRYFCIKSISVTYETSGEPQQIANSESHKGAQRVAVKYAKAFNAAMDITAYCTANMDSAWTECSSAYDTFLSEASALGSTEEAYAKNLIKYATAQYTDNSGEACIERMLKTYEICVEQHGQEAFMSSLVSLSNSTVKPALVSLSNNKNVILIVLVSIISVGSIGGYFFLRYRRKEEF